MARNAAPIEPGLRGSDAAPRAGAAAGLDAIFRRYACYVGAIALQRLGRDDEVDDVVQEVFLAALRGAGALRKPLAVRAWLATVTVRVAARRLRGLRGRMFLGLAGGLSGEGRSALDHLVAPGASPEAQALLARVYRVLDGFPVGERVPWTLRHVAGAPLDEVAALCGCSLATVKRRIGAARAKLAEAFRDRDL